MQSASAKFAPGESDLVDSTPGGADAVMVPFAAEHLLGALKLSQELAWPYRLEDWAFALRLGHGFVLLRHGKVIGTAAWFPYGETHATVGLIIVSSAAQGRGYGAKLMDALLAAAAPRHILLNSTPEGRQLYERRGFRPVGVIHQHQAVLATRHVAPPLDRVRAMVPEDFESVARLDAQASGLDRQPLLRRLLEVSEGLILLREGAAAGYAVTRPFGRGTVIGPVVAETTPEARLLIEAALSRLQGRFVRIDTSSETGLSSWFEEIGLVQVGDALTMVLGHQPETGPARVFALSNQSLN